MGAMLASRMRVLDRGLVRPGFFADLVVFDPQAVHDVATFADPLHYAKGIEHVIVHGKLVLEAGGMTAERPGRVIRR